MSGLPPDAAAPSIDAPPPTFWASALKLAAREAAASAGAGITVDSVFYSLDSYKTHAQSASGVAKFGLKEFRGLFRGFLPVVASGSAPSFAVFFSLYEPLKLSLQSDGRAAQNSAAVLATSGLCAVPASIVAVPSDVLKKRVVLGLEADANSAIRNIYRAGGVGGFFVGWRANVLKDVPFAAVKMCLYEGSVALYMRVRGVPPGSSIGSLENAGLGMVTGAMTGVMTCPLDVINTVGHDCTGSQSPPSPPPSPTTPPPTHTHAHTTTTTTTTTHPFLTMMCVFCSLSDSSRCHWMRCPAVPRQAF